MQAVARVGAVVGWHARGYRKLWRGSVTTSFLNPIFFLVSIGVLLGSLVDQGNPDLGGIGYLEFVAPGLLAVTAMQTAASVTTYPVMAGMKWWRTYHAIVSTPVRVSELVAGVLGWAAVRIGLAAGVFTLVAAVGGALISPLAALAPFAALLCGLTFAAILAALCGSLEDDQWLAAIYRFGLVPLFLFSGTFFPVERLPDWLEPLAWATPLWHGVELCRDLTTGRIELLGGVVHVAYLVVVGGAAAAVAVRAFGRRLSK